MPIDGLEREVLREAAAAIDRVHRTGPSDPRVALETWAALAAGRYSITDRFEADGRRIFVATRNDSRTESQRSLTARERCVAHQAARGIAHKCIAYDTGLAESAISVALRSALDKLGLRHRVELVELYASLFDAPAGENLSRDGEPTAKAS